MEKKLLLIKLMVVSGGIRQEQRRGHGPHKEGQNHPEESGHHCGHPKGPHGERGPHKLSPVAQSALCLLSEKGSLNQRTIAKSLNVTGQAVSELVKKLAMHELIRKELGELNNENIITLTEKGAEKAQEINQKLQTMATELFVSFTQEEIDTLFNLLEKINEASKRKETL